MMGHDGQRRRKLPDEVHFISLSVDGCSQFATRISAGARSAAAGLLSQRFVMLTLTPSTFFMSSYEQNAMATPGMTCIPGKCLMPTQPHALNNLRHNMFVAESNAYAELCMSFSGCSLHIGWHCSQTETRLGVFWDDAAIQASETVLAHNLPEHVTVVSVP